MASTKYCATECLLPLITATLQLTATFHFRFAKLDWAEHNLVMLTGCKRLSASRVGCVFLTSPPLAKDILCSVWCNDKDTANTFPPVVGLEDPVAMLGAVHGKKAYTSLKPLL